MDTQFPRRCIEASGSIPTQESNLDMQIVLEGKTRQVFGRGMVTYS